MARLNGSENGLTGTAAEPWNTPEEKQRYQRVKVGSGGKTAIRNARRKAEMHEPEGRRYTRLSREDWRKVVGEGPGREKLEGFYLTYAPAEKDMREQAYIVWRWTGLKTLLHRHAIGEPCVMVIEESENCKGQKGCEWIGDKKDESKQPAST